MERSASAASSSAGGARCRLCWGDAEEGGSPLVSPCHCRGSVGHIHVACLQRWLEVKRQQGTSRGRTVRCEVCRAKYDTSQLPAGTDCQALLPRAWSDPYAIAAALHGAWRAYVVVSGLMRAYRIYRSINAALPSMQAGSSGSGSSAMAGGGRVGIRAACAASRARGAAAGGGAAQPLQAGAPQRQHPALSVSPLATSGSGSSNKDVLATLRSRFEKATMVQVYYYTAIMALPQDPFRHDAPGGGLAAGANNAAAFAGMALGATVGGMVAQLVFLPMLGAGRLAALLASCQLLAKCMLRLLAAEACQPRGYRVLAGLIRGLMGRWQAARRRRRRRRRRGEREQQREQGQQQAQAAADAAGAGSG